MLAIALVLLLQTEPKAPLQALEKNSKDPKNTARKSEKPCP